MMMRDPAVTTVIGCELCNNPEVRKLFTQFGYDIRSTGADASNQNAPVEHGHLVVANAI